MIDIPMVGRVFEEYRAFTGVLRSGRLSCLFGHIGDGVTGLSHTIAGEVQAGSGKITIDDVEYGAEKLARIGVVLPRDYSGRRGKPVRKQLTEALNIPNRYAIQSVTELMELFRLDEDKLDSPLSTYGDQIWPATIAIGLARGKRIFCFPWMNPTYIKAHLDGWLGNSIRLLKRYDAWAVLPTSNPQALAGLVDDIFTVIGPFHYCAGRVDDLVEVVWLGDDSLFFIPKTDGNGADKDYSRALLNISLCEKELHRGGRESDKTEEFITSVNAKYDRGVRMTSYRFIKEGIRLAYDDGTMVEWNYHSIMQVREYRNAD